MHCFQKRGVLTNIGPPYFPSKCFYFHFLRNEPQKDSGISFPICVSTQSWFFWYRGSICSTPTSLCSVFGPSPNALGRSSHYEQCSDSKSSLPSGFLCFFSYTFSLTHLLKDICGRGKSLSEAFILTSTNPQYDNRLFIELKGQYMKIPSSNLGRTCYVQKLVLTFRTIFVHNMFSPCFAKRRASDKDLPVTGIRSQAVNMNSVYNSK